MTLVEPPYRRVTQRVVDLKENVQAAVEPKYQSLKQNVQSAVEPKYQSIKQNVQPKYQSLKQHATYLRQSVMLRERIIIAYAHSKALLWKGSHYITSTKPRTKIISDLLSFTFDLPSFLGQTLGFYPAKTTKFDELAQDLRNAAIAVLYAHHRDVQQEQEPEPEPEPEQEQEQEQEPEQEQEQPDGEADGGPSTTTAAAATAAVASH